MVFSNFSRSFAEGRSVNIYVTVAQPVAWKPAPRTAQFPTVSSAKFCCSYELLNGNSPSAASVFHAMTKKINLWTTPVQKIAIPNWIKGSIVCSDAAALGQCLTQRTEGLSHTHRKHWKLCMEKSHRPWNIWLKQSKLPHLCHYKLEPEKTCSLVFAKVIGSQGQLESYFFWRKGVMWPLMPQNNYWETNRIFFLYPLSPLCLHELILKTDLGNFIPIKLIKARLTLCSWASQAVKRENYNFHIDLMLGNYENIWQTNAELPPRSL